nr:hypothetical protein [Tanacetum cinerariifolium]
MVTDLIYFNSLKLEVDSLKYQLETQQTQFLNEIDRLSREYYYADHKNALLGVYTELDEKNVSQEIKDQLNAEAEAVQIILTGIDNDIYSTVDACPNACEMWKAVKRLKQGESINVQDLETNLYWEFKKFTSQDGESLESYYSRFYKMMNELIRNQCNVTNHQVNIQFLLQLQPEWQRFVTLVKQLVAQQQPVYHPQNHPTHYTQNSS